MSEGASNFLFSRIEDYGDRIALIAGGKEWSYRELGNRVEKAREFLRAREEKVFLVGPDYGVDTIALLLAGIGSGKILAPVATLDDKELGTMAGASGADALINGDLGIDARAVVKFPAVDGETKPPLVSDLLGRSSSGLILFSSGITGKPKAMLHDFEKFIESYRDRKERAVPILLFLLFDHIGGLNTLFGSLASGMTLVAPPDRDPETIAKLVEEHRVRILPATPSFLNLLLLAEIPGRYQLNSLRIITYGAEAMQPGLLDRIKRAFPKVRLIQTFGTSETGIARTAPRNDTFLRLDDPNLETKIVDGELWLRSGSQVLGYLNESNERFTEEGWFRTGDAVTVERDGSIRFVGRKKEMINVGGEKVYPGEVEAALLKMPEVGACRAFGVPNAILGQAVAVELIPLGEINPSELRSRVRKYARGALSRYKIPVDIRIVDEISINSRGKRVTGATRK